MREIQSLSFAFSTHLHIYSFSICILLERILIRFNISSMHLSLTFASWTVNVCMYYWIT